MKVLLIVLALYGHSALSLSRSDRSTTPKKSKYDPDEDYSDSSDEIELPKTSFSCDGKIDGFYADVENGCKSFHYCQTFVFPDDDPERKDWIFICPPPTIFRQQYLTCTNPHKSFKCEDSENYYDVNEELPPVSPGEKPTLPPPELDTTEPPTEEETTKPPITSTTKPSKPTTSTPSTTTESTTEPELPDSSKPEDPEDSDSLETKNPDMPEKPDGFYLPPFEQTLPPFSVAPYLSLVPTYHSNFYPFNPLVHKNSDKMLLNFIPLKKTDSKDKIDLSKKTLTLDDYLKKTSWENVGKPKAKLGDLPTPLKSPLIFPSFIPEGTHPLKFPSDIFPQYFTAKHFDDALLRYNGQIISDADAGEPLDPR